VALSNIFREPRREITESLIGGAGTLVPLILITRWFYLRWADPTIWETGEVGKNGFLLINSPFDLEGCATKCAQVRTYVNLEVLLAAFVVALAICSAGALIIHFTHLAGEKLCDALANGRLDPRPKQRR
jgi:hypothetical protein